jgi:hypothetical protein
MSVTHASHRAQALALVAIGIWLAAPIYACVVIFWSYLAIAGNAQRASGQSHLCHPFIYGSPAPLLLSRIRTPITKYISSCEVNSSTSTPRPHGHDHGARIREIFLRQSRCARDRLWPPSAGKFHSSPPPPPSLPRRIFPTSCRYVVFCGHHKHGDAAGAARDAQRAMH